MAKKRINEGLIDKFMSNVFDSVKKDTLKRITKKVDADTNLKKKLDDFDKSYKKLINHLKDEYGEEEVQDAIKKGEDKATEFLASLK